MNVGRGTPFAPTSRDSQGRRLDTEQIGAYQSAIHAVRECSHLRSILDASLDAVLADTLTFADDERED